MTLSVAHAANILEQHFHREDKEEIITICGGGNGAHTAAAFLAYQGYKVNVFTRRSSEWDTVLQLATAGSSWQHKGTLQGKLHIVSDKPEQVIPSAKIIIIAAPANAHQPLLEMIQPFISKNTILGTLYGQGGFDWCVKEVLKEKIDELEMVFGLQNIPWICKAVQYGKKAKLIGPKKVLYVASYPVEKKEKAAKLIEELFSIPCKTVANFLNLTLTPSNQIIHPARYYAIFRDWDGKKTYTKEELESRKGLTLYADFDDFSAEQLSMLDNELQQIKLAILQRFPAVDLSDVIPMPERVVRHYGEDVSDRSSLHKIFESNLGYSGCATPLDEVSPGQYQPCRTSRLFWEDIPYGLCILKNIAEMCGNLPVPRIEFMIRWHQEHMGIKFLDENGQLNPVEMYRTGCPNRYGIHSIQDLVSTSLPKNMLEYLYPQCKL